MRGEFLNVTQLALLYRDRHET